MAREIIYGVNPVMEALESNVDVKEVYVAVGMRSNMRRDIEQAVRKRGLRLLQAPRPELDGMCAGGTHQGVVAVCIQTRYLDFSELIALEVKPRTLILCLDEIQDPRNLGALARSALAFGATGLLIPARRAVGITSAAVKTSAGALSRLPVARVKNMAQSLQKMKKAGFWISGAVAEGGQEPWSINPGEKVALVLGSEGGGIRRRIESELDHRVSIPMAGSIESLNVSVAGALLLYEWLGRK